MNKAIVSTFALFLKKNMLTKNQIIVNIYNSPELKSCLLMVKESSIREDVRQEVFFELLKKNDEFIIGLHNRNELKAYITTCIFNEVYNPRSKTRKKLGKESVIFIDSTPLENILIEDIKKEIDVKKEKAIDFILNLPKDDFRKKILLSLVRYGSYRKLSKVMDIPHTTIRYIVSNFVKEIKNNI